MQTVERDARVLYREMHFRLLLYAITACLGRSFIIAPVLYRRPDAYGTTKVWGGKLKPDRHNLYNVNPFDVARRRRPMSRPTRVVLSLSTQKTLRDASLRELETDQPADCGRGNHYEPRRHVTVRLICIWAKVAEIRIERKNECSATT